MIACFVETEKCLFCEKPKTWKSELVCFDPRAKTVPLFIVTICPKCRKAHTIEDIYVLVQEKMMKDTQAYLEKWRRNRANFIFTVPRLCKRK